GRPGCDFSFSGLKTAVAHALREQPRLEDVAALFQAAVLDVVADRLRNGLAMARERAPDLQALVAAGGVASNAALRALLQDIAGAEGLRLVVPPPALCTDNAAMIAWAGVERLRLGLISDLTAPARARWPLS